MKYAGAHGNGSTALGRLVAPARSPRDCESVRSRARLLFTPLAAASSSALCPSPPAWGATASMPAARAASCRGAPTPDEARSGWPASASSRSRSATAGRCVGSVALSFQKQRDQIR
jgi:hypothetical protein